jgi:hypothetical protein
MSKFTVACLIKLSFGREGICGKLGKKNALVVTPHTHRGMKLSFGRANNKT